MDKWPYFGKYGYILIKSLFLKLSFQDEDIMQANFLKFVLTLYRKCRLLEFFSHSIRMHIPMLTRVQIRPTSH